MKETQGKTVDTSNFREMMREGDFTRWVIAWTPPEVEAMAQGGVRDEINVGSLWKDKSK